MVLDRRPAGQPGHEVGLKNDASPPWSGLPGDTFEKQLRRELAERFGWLADDGQEG